VDVLFIEKYTPMAIIIIPIHWNVEGISLKKAINTIKPNNGDVMESDIALEISKRLSPSYHIILPIPNNTNPVNKISPQCCDMIVVMFDCDSVSNAIEKIKNQKIFHCLDGGYPPLEPFQKISPI